MPDIVEAMRDDPDWADLIDVDWSNATIVYPRAKHAISIRLDKDIVDFFKATGQRLPDAHQRGVALLRRRETEGQEDRLKLRPTPSRADCPQAFGDWRKSRAKARLLPDLQRGEVRCVHDFANHQRSRIAISRSAARERRGRTPSWHVSASDGLALS